MSALERSATYSRQLNQIKKETLEKPPTDERENILWVIERVRDMIIKVDKILAEDRGKPANEQRSVENNFKGIEAIFRRFFNP